MFALNSFRRSMLPLILPSPAKINIGLHVLDQRPDGFHNIESIFVAIDVCDVVTISPAETIEIECHPPMTDVPTNNLVFKAARLLQESTSTSQGAKIVVTKRIPAGAGLGGGSSNAATTLLGLNTLWELNLSLDELSDLGNALGSDVPFFIRGGVAHVQGTGNIVTPINAVLPWTIVVVTPNIHSSTAEAYASVIPRTAQERKNHDLVNALLTLISQQPSLASDVNNYVGNTFHNDFTSYLVERHPIIATISTQLTLNNALFTSVSGSGSSVYGLFASSAMAQHAASALAPYHPYICHPMKPWNTA